MKSLAILLALVAPAEVSRSALLDRAHSVMKSRGRPTLDIRELGAEPGPKGKTATRRALQAAIDALDQKGVPPGRKTVYIPPGEWWIDRWIFVETDDLTIRGDGPSSAINVSAGGYSALMIGIPRRPVIPKEKPHVMTRSHWFDLHGKLDASAAPSAGKRFGFRNGDLHLAGWAGPFNLGPPEGWSSCKGLTVEFALDTTDVPIRRAHICGMSEKPRPRPWIVIGGGDVLSLLYQTDDRTTHNLTIDSPKKPGVHRFAFQLDLEAGKASAFLDGRQVATKGGTPEAGSRLSDNDNEPFHVGGSGASAVGRSDYFQSNETTDLALCGLRVSRVARYADAGVGRPIARRDGGKVDDGSSYFAIDDDTVALLPMTDDPDDVAPDRWVSVRTGMQHKNRRGEVSALLAVSRLHKSEFNAVKGVRLQDFKVQVGPWYGDAVTLGCALRTEIEGCILIGGAHGLGNPHWLVNYVTSVRRSTLQGSDAAIYGWSAMMRLEEVHVPYHGRNTFWFSTSQVFARNIFMDNGWCSARAPETYVRLLGGSFDAHDVGSDTEDGLSPTVAMVAAQALAWDGSGEGAYLSLRRCGVGKIPKDVPLVKLTSVSYTRAGVVRVTDPLTYAPVRALVETDGGWNGVIDCLVDRGYPLLLDSAPTGPPPPRQERGWIEVLRRRGGRRDGRGTPGRPD